MQSSNEMAECSRRAAHLSRLPRVLEFEDNFGDRSVYRGGFDGIFTVIIGICNQIGGVEAILPTSHRDPDTQEMVNRYRIAFWQPATAARLAGPYPGQVGRNLHPLRPLRVGDRLVGLVRWASDPYHPVSHKLMSFMTFVLPQLKRSWYPRAAGTNTYMNLDEDSSLRAVISRYYREVLTDIRSNSYYHPDPRFRQDPQGRHFVEFSDLYGSMEVLKKCISNSDESGVGGYEWRTIRQYVSEWNQMRSAGGDLTYVGHGRTGPRPSFDANPWAAFMDHSVSGSARQTQRLREGSRRGCTQEPTCAAYRRSGFCTHFRDDE